MRQKRHQTQQGSYRPPASPERTVLVPASSSPGMPSPDSRFPPARSGIIPSSNLSRPNNNSASHGTPDGVMRAMMARKEEKANGNGKSGSNGNDNDRLPQLSDLFDTPPSRSAPRGHDTSSPGVPRPKTPSLVAAAQASQQSSQGSSVDDYISRLISQFPTVPRSEVMALHRQYPNDKAKVSLGVRAAARRLSQAPASTSSSSLNSAMAASNLHVPVARAQASPVKPRKNENSAIYSKRGNDGKKRRGSDSESEGQMSDAESEMDWSGDEGPRKRKKKNDDVIRPEKAALKAFNENTVEELTGTIGTFAGEAVTLRSS
jgi:hypothetical protein